MSQFPLIEKLKDVSNIHNPFLLRPTENNVVEFLWPTTESGAYFRVSAWTKEEYESIASANKAMCVAFGDGEEKSFFSSQVSDEQVAQVVLFMFNTQTVFYKEPVFDVNDFTLKHASVGKYHEDQRLHLNVSKGDVVLEAPDGVIYFFSSSNYILPQAT